MQKKIEEAREKSLAQDNFGIKPCKYATI